MSTDISTVEEVAFGAARTAAEVASDPIGSARKQVKGLKRKGSPTARKVNRQLTEQINAATAPAMDAVKSFGKAAEKVAADLLPERIAMRGLHVVKVQAKRQDQVGEVAKRTLKMFNGSFKTIARVASRLEKASDLPVSAPRKATAPRRSARRTTARRNVAA
ncbi:MAG: hypothetical protein E6I23_04535 [Chloroflexi bacterium]|nr:MAG: hypothetical protein AUH32_01070 [Actinobacteria bacterium 13_1_40CM_66_12]TMF45670.1 MAG: hypothetical protein E6I23_04535 [Chloroflexota bacterium]